MIEWICINFDWGFACDFFADVDLFVLFLEFALFEFVGLIVGFDFGVLIFA